VKAFANSQTRHQDLRIKTFESRLVAEAELQMTDALVGVIVGGVLASVMPILNFFRDGKRWKLEKRLERARERKRQFEEQAESVLKRLSKAMSDNLYPSEMISDIGLYMP
jgi:hypothetical protein